MTSDRWYRAVHALLRGAASPEQFCAETGAGVAGAALYADSVRRHVVSTLRKNFTALPSAIGEARFGALAAEFFEARPARHPELNRCVEAFPDFLDELRPQAPWLTLAHVELARLEWQEVVVSLAPDPSTPHPRLAPVLRIVASTHAVAAQAARLRAGERVEAEARTELAFVYRPVGGAGYVTLAADDELLFAFKLAHDGLTLAQARAASGATEQEIRRVLARAEAIGLLVRGDARADAA